jgi:hypothetical protein
MMIIPAHKPYVMENPVAVQTGVGNWAFWLACDDMALYDVVALMPGVASLHYEDVWRRAHVLISPLYDHEEVWLYVDARLSEITLAQVLS